MTARLSVVLAVLAFVLATPSLASAQIARVGDPDVTNPVMRRMVAPLYSDEAKTLKIEGSVYIDAVIGADGLVREARISRSLDAVHGLDEAALRAVGQWVFKPAMKTDGTAVSMPVTLEVAFRLTPFGEGARRPFERGITAPVVLKEVKPNYTPGAMAARLQGSAAVDIVVGTNGTVTDARIFQSVDKQYGLDDEALRAARQWIFTPGTLNGVPVPVQVTIHLEFRLH
jgi:TonB family protein